MMMGSDLLLGPTEPQIRTHNRMGEIWQRAGWGVKIAVEMGAIRVLSFLAAMNVTP